MNRFLIGKKAAEFRKENLAKVITVEEGTLKMVMEGYAGFPGIVLDVSNVEKKDIQRLLKFAEEQKDLVCLSVRDVDDSVLLSRFCVEKENLYDMGSPKNMRIMDFMALYAEIVEESDEVKKLYILENCPKFVAVPKGKVLQVLAEGQ